MVLINRKDLGSGLSSLWSSSNFCMQHNNSLFWNLSNVGCFSKSTKEKNCFCTDTDTTLQESSSLCHDFCTKTVGSVSFAEGPSCLRSAMMVDLSICTEYSALTVPPWQQPQPRLTDGALKQKWKGSGWAWDFCCWKTLQKAQRTERAAC